MQKFITSLLLYNSATQLTFATAVSFAALFALFLVVLITKAKCRKHTIGFFHPNCDSGGGGERVLWCLVQHILKLNDAATLSKVNGSEDASTQSKPLQAKSVVIYFRDYAAACAAANTTYCTSSRSKSVVPLLKYSPLILDILDRFSIDLSPLVPSEWPVDSTKELPPLALVPLRSAFLLNASNYRFASIFAQCMASIVACAEALFKFTPEFWVDTVGYPFTLPMAHYIGKCHTSTYVHYPLINLKALLDADNHKVKEHPVRWVVPKLFYELLRKAYYYTLAFAYGWAGRRTDWRVTNSSWTQNHIQALWKCRSQVHYPPIDLTSFSGAGDTIEKENGIISVAQFRPEKNHALQLDVLETLLTKHGQNIPPDLILYMCGSTRNAGDEELVESLKIRCQASNVLTSHVRFCVNLSMKELVRIEQKCKIALHTMEEEHFGIALVEFLAAKLIVIAHNSGGPKTDILCPSTDQKQIGYLANNLDEYVFALYEALSSDSTEKIESMRAASLASLSRYCNNEEFGQTCCKAMGLE